TAEVIRQVAILAQPFMPASAAKLLDLLGIPEDERNFSTLGGARRITPGTRLPMPSPVFPRYEVKEIAPGVETKEGVGVPTPKSKKTAPVPQEKNAPFPVE